jgi:hypothetical protein
MTPSMSVSKTVSMSVIPCSYYESKTSTVSLTTSDEMHTENKVDFQFIENWQSQGMYPAIGYTQGGTIVSINGITATGEDDIGKDSYKCQFNTVLVPASINTTTNTLECTSPAMDQAGIANMSVIKTDVGSVFTSYFTYLTQPSDVTIYPSVGSINGGTLIQISSTGSSGDTSSFYEYGSFAYCKFMDIIVLGEVYVDEDQAAITCMTPAILKAGSVPLYLSPNGLDFVCIRSYFYLYAFCSHRSCVSKHC